MKLLTLLKSYRHTKQLKLRNQAQLQHHQYQQLTQFFNHILIKSPYFSHLLFQNFGQPPYAFDPMYFQHFPTMDKSLMLEKFNQMNTVGLDKTQAFDLAMRAEKNRDFSATIGDISIGLSSGTSGQRGLFAVSPQEQAQWAGVMLAKMLPKGLLHGERVALFLRANSNLYNAVKTPFLSFDYYDLFQPFATLLKRLALFKPTIIVAPTQVLVALCEAASVGKIHLHPIKVISCAEVLSLEDRRKIQQVFPNVHEVYQATEGFLASTCEYGTLHLNEEYLYIEKIWLDNRRFMPIITDFTRSTQPIVRYILNDVLVVADRPCACGSICLALSHIEGRSDDRLKFNDVVIFADSLSRLIALHLPVTMDYRLIQRANHLTLQANIDASNWENFKRVMSDYLFAQGVNTTLINWQLERHSPTQDFSKKRRRIVCEMGTTTE